MPLDPNVRTAMDGPAPVIAPRTPPRVAPATNSAGTPASGYVQDLLAWCILAVREGEAINMIEGEIEDVDENIRIALGDQRNSNTPSMNNNSIYRNNYNMSRVGKNINDLASSITDFRPIGQYKTYNTLYETQGGILDKLMTSWWYNMDIDIKIQLLAKQSLIARTAYAQVVFNPSLHFGLGDLDIVIRDYRDVLLIRPNSKSSVQDALGVVIKSKNTVNWGRARYADKADKIIANNEGGLAAAWGARGQVTSPQLDYLARNNTKKKTDFAIPTYDHYEVYVKDGSINDSKSKVWVGPKSDPGDAEHPWGYWVESGDPLYPQLRLIVLSNLSEILFDGGSPYWHGMFPLIKLTLDPWPMTYLGRSAVVDAKSSHKAHNELFQGVIQACRKAIKPGIIVDRQAVNRQVLDQFDSSQEGYKLRSNPSTGSGIVFEPPPQIPEYVMAMMQKADTFVDHSMGILDMRALAQLKTLNTDTNVEALLENLGPSIRTKGRVLEVFLRELGMMMRANFFQFYTVARRIEILGQDGMDFEDFDFDPGSLIPAFTPGMIQSSFGADSGKEEDRFYNKDKTPKTRAERARAHIRSFSYFITPNSLLSLAKTQDKLLYLQLFRMNCIDIMTLLEKLDVPNIGEIPGQPKTILERMQFAAQQGLVGAVSAAGRKATGQQMPEIRSDGKVSESG